MGFLRKNIVFPLADLVMRTKTWHYFRVIKDMNSWSQKKIEEWQSEKLADLINHSYNNTVYYRNLFDENNIKPSDIKTIDDLHKIPPLTKKIIRENYRDLIPSNIRKYPYKKGQTGGSTAEPLQYLQDLNSWSYCYANHNYNWGKLGYEIGDNF